MQSASRSAGRGASPTTDTYALLKRIQEHGEFFDKVNTLRVQMQASLGIEDHAALTEILHLRRDLWAASEIVLVEDPASFGTTFAEAGSYERFRDEAVRLLFKSAEPPHGDGDSIDLRLSLASKDADAFIVELREAIRLAQERDRLPTIAEITAYPLAVLRAMPEKLRLSYRFLRALFAYAGEAARTIRDSETMARGRRHLQQAREDLPQRLSAGFERASAAARDSAAGLHRHYDFLAAAHDFQAKYEQLLRRAPEITERGRQFIARLDLAERSERLRLTSANAMIWLARRLIDGLALAIAGLQRLHAALSQTTPWAFAAMVLAPAPVRGRRTSAFRSYGMALAASGLAERPRPIAAAGPSARARASRQKKGQAARSAAPPPAKKPGRGPAERQPGNAAPSPAKSEAQKPAKPAAKQRAGAGKIEPATLKPMPKAAETPAAPSKPPPAPATKPARTPVVAAAPPALLEEPPRPVMPAMAEADAPVRIADMHAEETFAPPPEKRPSFLARIFARRKGTSDERASPAEIAIGDAAAALAEADAAMAAAMSETVANPPRLLEKLSEIAGIEPVADVEEEEPVDDEALEKSAEPADEPGPLTLSLMELQAKIVAKPPQIRAFPWLRG